MKKITPPVREFFIGIDVSKDTLDAALMICDYRRRDDIVHAQFKNNKTGLREFDKWLIANKVARSEQTMLVIENTGRYHYSLWDYCSKHDIRIHIGNGAHIKWSMGLARGKNDRVDSERLCDFCFKNVDMLQPAPAPDPTLLKLKVLIATRTRLVRNRSGHKADLASLNCTMDGAFYEMVRKDLQSALDGIAKSIEKVERQIEKLIRSSDELSKNYELLLSVPGIGPVTAA